MNINDLSTISKKVVITAESQEGVLEFEVLNERLIPNFETVTKIGRILNFVTSSCKFSGFEKGQENEFLDIVDIDIIEHHEKEYVIVLDSVNDIYGGAFKIIKQEIVNDSYDPYELK